MANKKLLIVGAGCATLLVVVLIIVAGIVGATFYTIGHSEAAQTAKDFLRRNEKLRADVGDVRDFGWLVTGSIDTHNADGDATLRLKVIGARRSAPASVRLAYREGKAWRVTGASFEAADGRTVSLFDPYAEAAAQDEQTEAAAAAAGFDEPGYKANVLESKGLVLVFVGSPSSLDSRAVEQTLDRMGGKYSETVTLMSYTIDEQPGVLVRLRVQVVPTLILYVDGRERARLTGAVSRDEIAAMLDKHLREE